MPLSVTDSCPMFRMQIVFFSVTDSCLAIHLQLVFLNMTVSGLTFQMQIVSIDVSDSCLTFQVDPVQICRPVRCPAKSEIRPPIANAVSADFVWLLLCFVLLLASVGCVYVSVCVSLSLSL